MLLGRFLRIGRLDSSFLQRGLKITHIHRVREFLRCGRKNFAFLPLTRRRDHSCLGRNKAAGETLYFEIPIKLRRFGHELPSFTQVCVWPEIAGRKAAAPREKPRQRSEDETKEPGSGL